MLLVMKWAEEVHHFAVPYHFYKGPLLNHILSQLKPVHILIPFLNKQTEHNLDVKQRVIERPTWI